MLLPSATSESDIVEESNIVSVEVLPPSIASMLPEQNIDKKAVAVAVQEAMRLKTKYTNQLNKLGPHHVQMVLARVGGVSVAEIAKLLGVTTSTVHNALRSPAAQGLMGELFAEMSVQFLDMKRRYEAMSPSALNILNDIMHDPMTKKETRVNVAFGVLDRAGYGAVHKTQQEHIFRVSDDKADELVNALKESQEVQEIEYELVRTDTEAA